MQPLSALSSEHARALRGVLFDLDDTFLTHGKLTRAATSALFALHEAGLDLYAVTGRPAGWGRLVAAQWPVTGAVTENGAIAFRRVDGRVEQLDRLSAEERRERSRRLGRVAATLLEEFPSLRLTDDGGMRIADVAFDIGEYQRLPAGDVVAVESRARELGVRVVRSSIHLHITLETDDKATGALRLIRLCKEEDPTRARYTHAFIGDSENDAACFSAFTTSIGVANLRGRFTEPPRFITAAAMGEGFAEAAATILQKR
jgi:hydroxymethylpyrimidine pyrophosphatase-like HAD family hydrolase